MEEVNFASVTNANTYFTTTAMTPTKALQQLV